MRASYSIPAEIKEKIPQDFYAEFLKCLQEVFGSNLMTEKKGVRGIDFITGTNGWAGSLEKACRMTKCEWLYDYWHNLPWHDSDLFDEEIAELMRF